MKLKLLLAISFLLFFAACQGYNDNKNQQKILLVSIDGFRADYMALYNTPNLDEFADQGVTTDYMIPVFPTKTFPNHYSIATGLYVENSGIVSNRMYDPKFDEYFSLANRAAVQDAKWYQGEPIWVTAEKQGLKTAPLFWPGSEAPIGGIRPSRWSPYDEELPYKARVDSVIHWLQLKDDSAPAFMSLYFSKVDSYGHWYGPESDSVAVAVEEIDSNLGYLKDELERIAEWNNLNIIIVSDHGMTEISEEKVILIDNIVNLDHVEMIDWAPVTMMRMDSERVESVYKALKRNEKNYKVYKKDEIPSAYGYKNHRRVHDIIIVADVGYTVSSNERMISSTVRGGNHGYSHIEPDMRSFFIARGRVFKKDIRTEPFQSIHLYELMAHLLNIDPAHNDGNLDSLLHIIDKDQIQ